MDWAQLSRRHEPTVYKRREKIYIFTTGCTQHPSDIRSLPDCQLACVGFDGHWKPGYFKFPNWNKVNGGSGDDSISLKIALTMFAKKIVELKANMNESRALQERGHPADYVLLNTLPMTREQISINNTVDLLTHLCSRLEQRIVEKGQSSQYVADENFYTYPLILIDANIEVVFYHGPIERGAETDNYNTSFDHDFWRLKFIDYTSNVFDPPDANAMAIDIIYPPSFDGKKQKLGEFERLYHSNEGDSGITESNSAVRKATARRIELAEQAIEKENATAKTKRIHEQIDKIEAQKRATQEALDRLSRIPPSTVVPTWRDLVRTSLSGLSGLWKSKEGTQEGGKSKRVKRVKQSKHVKRPKSKRSSTKRRKH